MHKLDINGQTLVPSVTAFEEIIFEAGEKPLAGTPHQALIISNDTDIDTIGDMIASYGAIILHFPAFTDGRAYSQARLLRERYGFQGHIIARGDVLADQLLFMRRCGINTIEIPTLDTKTYQDALSAFSAFYQPSADQITPVWEARTERQKAAA